jgi:hypothetical protein
MLRGMGEKAQYSQPLGGMSATNLLRSPSAAGKIAAAGWCALLVLSNIYPSHDRVMTPSGRQAGAFLFGANPKKRKRVEEEP